MSTKKTEAKISDKEKTVMQFMNAVIAKNSKKVKKNIQLSWRMKYGKPDSIRTLIENMSQIKEFTDIKIQKVSDVSCKADVTVFVDEDPDRRKLQMMLICEIGYMEVSCIGEWGVNPNSLYLTW